MIVNNQPTLDNAGAPSLGDVTKGSRMRAGSVSIPTPLPAIAKEGRSLKALRAQRVGIARGGAFVALGAFMLSAFAGCGIQNMVTQPKYETFQPTSFFANGASARPLEPGTVARGQLRVNPGYDTGAVDGYLVGDIPLKEFDPKQPSDSAEANAARRAIVERGQQRFNIYCSPCHAQTGLGNGIVVQRGFSKPPSLHLDRLREAPAGHFFHVISNGYGAMYSYASRIQPADRWAIVAYIRTLQLSQNAKLDDASTGDRARLEGMTHIQGASASGGGNPREGNDAPATKKDGGAK